VNEVLRVRRLHPAWMPRKPRFRALGFSGSRVCVKASRGEPARNALYLIIRTYRCQPDPIHR